PALRLVCILSKTLAGADRRGRGKRACPAPPLSTRGTHLMARVFKPTYSAPIPADAVRVTLTRKRRGKLLDVPGVRLKGDDGRSTTAPLTSDGTKILLPSPFWYGRVKLCTNKAAAETMLGDKIKLAERREAGLEGQHQEHHATPIADHIAAWRHSMLAE